MKDENFAPYLMFTGGLSALEKKAFEYESVANGYDNSVKTHTGGEFGFIYAKRFVALRFGFEILRPQKLSEVSATQDGTKVYNLDSDILGYIPKVAMDISFLSMGNHRLFISGGVGLANISVKNDYTNLTIAPNTSHSVEYKGSGNMIQGGLGWEYYAFDRTTLVIEGVYKQLVVDNFQYTNDVTTFDGFKHAGQDVYTLDGKKRSMDFTGVYASIGFRIWL